MKMRRFKNEKMNKMPEIPKVFKNEVSADGSQAKLTIYGDIGESWWGDSISAVDVKEALNGVDAKQIDVHINSYGGDVFDGVAIYNQLKNHPAEISVYVDGLAASAASLIAMAGDKITMNTGSQLMIHEASTFAYGNKGDIQKTLGALESIDKSIVDIYMTRYTGEREEIETMLKGETWFTSNEAVDIGLADAEEETVTDAAVDPEAYKNSILERFRNKKRNPETTVTLDGVVAASAKPNLLNKFKRQ